MIMIRCNKCNTELPEESVACYKCGTFIEMPTFVSKSPQLSTANNSDVGLSTGTIAVTVIAVLVILALGIGVFLYSESQKREADRQRAQTEQAQKDAEAAKRQVEDLKRQQQERDQKQAEQQRQIERQQQQNQQQQLQDEVAAIPVKTPNNDSRTVRVDASNIGTKGFWQRFVIPKNGGTLTGRLEGEGGERGEFSVYIVDDSQLTDFRNGQRASTYFSQENLTVQDISVALDPGIYYVLLTRGSGAWVGRSVTGTLKIVR